MPLTAMIVILNEQDKWPFKNTKKAVDKGRLLVYYMLRHLESFVL